MSYISFYRKWRPQSFKEIIGQEYNIKAIRNAIAHDRLSHCYIFCGPRGTGKTSTARILAKALNCEKGVTPDPCNKCKNCTSISDGSSIDVVEIDAASNRGINEIRELREKVKYLPNVLRKKVYIIDEVHMLTTEAFNALLKILEEPPEHVLFIMATTEPNKVIPTILSRCQRFDFLPIPMDKIRERLRSISASEKIDVSESAIDLISKYADGSLRDADSILEKLASFSGNKIEVENVVSLLGITDLDFLFKLTDILIKKNVNEGFLLVNEIIKSNQNLKVFVSEFVDYLYDLYVIKNYPDPYEIIDVSKDYREKYLKRAEKLSNEEIEYYMELFVDLLKQVKWGESSRIFFKSALIKAINFIVMDEKEINRKISGMEAQIESLKDRLGKIDISGGVTTRAGRSNEGRDAVAYEEEDDDFDIINTDEIDRMVSEVGNQRINKRSDTGSKKLHPEKEKSVSETGVSKKPDNEINSVDLIRDNINEITKVLKSKKISVHAMFVESKLDRVEGNVLYFSLNKNKQWHKDHLNKDNNANLVSDVIKKVTGRNYIVRFEVKEDSNRGVKKKEVPDKPEKKDKDEEKKNDAGSSSVNKNSEAGISRVPEDGNKDKEIGGSGEDILGYFEEKFKIKE